MSGQPFPVDPQLTGIVIAYGNAELIADRVLPRVAPALTRKEFKYLQFDFAQMITVPDTKVGRKGEPNEVEFAGEEKDASTKDYGLDDVIPQDDIDQAPAGYDPRAFAAQGLMDMVLLDREKRVADKVNDLNTYPTANKATLSGTSQWSDFVNSDPTAAVMSAADGLVMRPNVGVLGRPVWSTVRRHPKIIAAISQSGTDKGVATVRAVADLWELDDLVIGSAWINTQRPGQAPVLTRAWGKHFTLLRQDRLSTSMNQRPTFGWTAQFGTRVAGSIPEPKVGLRGAVRVRAGESVAEVISAPDLAYHFHNAVA